MLRVVYLNGVVQGVDIGVIIQAAVGCYCVNIQYIIGRWVFEFRLLLCGYMYRLVIYAGFEGVGGR